MYLILLPWSLHPLSINNWILYGYTNYYDVLFLCWFVIRLISPAACCLFIICLSLSVFRLCKTVSVKNGWPAGNPPHVVYFNCSLLSVIWRIKYYYYYYASDQLVRLHACHTGRQSRCRLMPWTWPSRWPVPCTSSSSRPTPASCVHIRRL